MILVGIGCLVFAQGSEPAGMFGFVLQAIGAIFAFIGSSYVFLIGVTAITEHPGWFN